MQRQICTDLSQVPMQAREASPSAIDTRFFSPPLTPRIALSPTGVVNVCRRPKTVASVFVASSVKFLREVSMRTRGVLADAANDRVSPTDSDGKCTSSSGQYRTSPR